MPYRTTSTLASLSSSRRSSTSLSKSSSPRPCARSSPGPLPQSKRTGNFKLALRGPTIQPKSIDILIHSIMFTFYLQHKLGRYWRGSEKRVLQICALAAQRLDHNRATPTMWSSMDTLSLWSLLWWPSKMAVAVSEQDHAIERYFAVLRCDNVAMATVIHSYSVLTLLQFSLAHKNKVELDYPFFCFSSPSISVSRCWSFVVVSIIVV